MRAIGLMSGTSLDGIDVALIETDGERITAFGPSVLHLYGEAEVALLRQALDEGRTVTARTARSGALAEAEKMVTALHAAAVEVFLDAHRIDPAGIDVVGFHGQTVLHRPHERLTVQIGDGQALAAKLRVPVVYDFRAADIAAGGQGAPLVPVFHQALVAGLDRPRPVVVLNIGGVANITYVDGSGPLLACDTGPGNALIDDFMRARTGNAYDDGGITASRGTVDHGFVERVLADPFFARPPPKSLDRNAFSHARLAMPRGSVPDGAATLAALTASAVARIVPHLPAPPMSFIVAGGGARNRTLVRMLADRLAPATVETADGVGWSADALEAQAFGYLAVRRINDLPITFPSTTGAPAPTIGGVIARPG